MSTKADAAVAAGRTASRRGQPLAAIFSSLVIVPPHLGTIVPAAAAAAAVDFPFQNGIATPYLVQWRTYTSGVTPQPNLFNDQPFWIAKFRELGTFTAHSISTSGSPAAS